MASTFGAGIDRLIDKVGTGKLVGRDHVNQFYAIYVHEILRNHHPVGHAKFLERALHEGAAAYFSAIGERILEGGGVQAMVATVQDFADAAQAGTPEQFGILRKSHHLTVEDNGAVAWERPPDAAPISRSLYEALLRGAGRTNHKYGR